MQKLSLLSLSLIILLLAGCDASTLKPQPQAPIAGGWSTAAVDADTKAVAMFAARQIGQNLKSIEAVQTQVVAGTNYKLDLTLADSSRWHVVVWRMLDGQLKLTESNKIP